MKAIFLLICASLVCSVLGQQVGTFPPFNHFTTSVGSAYVARLISSSVINGILKSGEFHTENVKISRDAQIPFAPINFTLPFPELADPMNLLPIRFPLDLETPDYFSSGYFAICEPQLKGLSKIDGSLGVSYELETKIAIISLDISLPSIIAESFYSTNAHFNDSTGEAVLLGSGAFLGGLEGFFVRFIATGHLPTGDRLTLDDLNFDFGFDKVILDIENLELNGLEIDLGAIANLIKTLYDSLWQDLREPITEMVRCSIDHAINDCVILDLISGVYDCLKPINPECFGPEGLSIVNSLTPTQEPGTCGATNPPTVPTTTIPPTSTPTTPPTTTSTTTPPPPTSTRPPTTTGPPPVCSLSKHLVQETSEQLPPHIVQMGQEFLAQSIVTLFLSRLSSGNFNFESFGAGEQFPFVAINLTLPLPELPDPINLLPLRIPLDFESETSFTSGFFQVCYPQVNGLSGLQDNLVLSIDVDSRAVTVDMTLILPSITVDSTYTTDVFMNGTTTEEAIISGNGELSGGFNGFYLFFKATGKIADRLSLDELDFDFCFDDVLLDIENLELNGEQLNLDAIAGLVRTMYNLIWVPGRETIVEMARCSIDFAVSECVLLDLISGVYDCLRLANSGCMGESKNDFLRILGNMNQDPGFCDISETPQTSTEIPTTSDVSPTSTEIPTSSDVSPTSTEIPTTSDVSPTSTEIPTSSDVSPTSTEIPTSSDVSPTSTEIPTSPDVSPTSTEIPTSSDVSPTSTEIPTSSDVSPTSTANSTSPNMSDSTSLSTSTESGVIRLTSFSLLSVILIFTGIFIFLNV